MLKYIYNNSFTKKAISIFSGSLLANIISFFGFFIIAKLFDINVLGEYYIYLSIVTILVMVVNFGYLQTIQLLDDIELKKMCSSIFILASGILILLSPIIFWYYSFAMFIIVSTILTLYFSLSEQIFIRKLDTRRLNIIRIGRVVMNLMFIISSFLIFKNDIFYMIFMNTISILVVDILIYIYYLKEEKLFVFKIKDIKILSSYSDFPKFIGPGMILHTIAYQIPLLIAGAFFSPAIAAQYNMAYKLAYTPAILISGSISQVFKGRLSKIHRDKRDIFAGFNKFALILFVGATVFMMLNILFLPSFIEYFFGKDWMLSIDISMALLPLIFSLVAVAPLTNIFQFTKNQKEIFKLHLISLLIASVSFSIAVILNDFVVGVGLFATLMLIRYIYIGIKLKKIKKDYCEAH